MASDDVAGEPATSSPTVVPVLIVLALAGTRSREPGPVLVVLVALVLGGAVLAAVHHAEVISHRVGEPFGSLVLAVAVAVVEVALIVTLMVAGARARRRWPGTPCSPR
jgi:Ca2+:H+ antiporter